MPKKRKIQMVVDMCMEILLFLLMAYALVGEELHEWMGIVMFLLFVVHHILNRQWLTHLLKGKYTPVRILETIVQLLLVIIMVLLPVSGMFMARYTVTFMRIPSVAGVARTVHLVTAYWGFVLMGLHLGMHWNRILGVIRQKTEKDGTIRRKVLFSRTVLFVCSLYGIYAFWKRQIPDYLLLRSHFVFFDFSEPRILFFLDYMAVALLFGIAGFYVKTGLMKLQQKKRKQ